MKSFQEICNDESYNDSIQIEVVLARTIRKIATELDERFPITKKPQGELNDTKRVDWENAGE